VETKEILSEMEHKMTHSVEVLHNELGGVRTGKASPTLLDGIKVEYYGTMVPLNQVGTVGTPDGRTITVQPWEQSMLAEIERVILKSDLGLTPNNDGTILHLPIPPLTEERRLEYVKLIKKMGEDCKVSIRNVRRDSNDRLKREEKEHNISEDDNKRLQKTVQDATDQHILDIDASIATKEIEIMEI
jgi:ribosome recycling factor